MLLQRNNAINYKNVSLILYRCATSNLKKVGLELGGKSPLIIFDDCDMDRAVRYVSAVLRLKTGFDRFKIIFRCTCKLVQIESRSENVVHLIDRITNSRVNIFVFVIAWYIHIFIILYTSKRILICLNNRAAARCSSTRARTALPLDASSSRRPFMMNTSHASYVSSLFLFPNWTFNVSWIFFMGIAKTFFLELQVHVPYCLSICKILSTSNNPDLCQVSFEF